MEPVPRPGLENTLIMKLETRAEISLASCVILNSNRLKSIVARLYNFTSNNIHIVSVGEWDAPLFHRFAKSRIKEENLVLFFGTIAENKGIEYLVMAEPYITSKVKNVKIVIAGSGNLSKYIKYMKNRNNFIIINRYINYDEGSILFQKTKIVVLPYTYGTISGIVITAYSFKKAIVATSSGLFPEIIEDGKTGILVPPRDPIALASAIVSLLKNDKLRKN